MDESRQNDLWLVIVALAYVLINVFCFDKFLRAFGWETGVAVLALTPPIFATLTLFALSLAKFEFRALSIVAFIAWMFVVGFVNVKFVAMAAANV